MSIKRRMAGEASAMERTAMPSEREMGGEMGTAATSAVEPSSISRGMMVTPRLC